MDSVAAKRLIDDLLAKLSAAGEFLGTWERENQRSYFERVAMVKNVVKVFDPDLVQRAGKDRQLKQWAKKLSLKDKLHPNLVRVFDGGECPGTGYFLVVMELIRH